jgi:agmatinase
MPTKHPDMFTAEAVGAGWMGPLQSGPGTFLKAPGVACETKAIQQHKAKAVFLGVPFDQATVYRSGSSLAPKWMRIVSDQYLPYLGDFDINLFDEFGLIDCGDVPMIPANAERCRNNIEDYVTRILKAGAMPICIGGDHSLPIPIGAALSKHLGSKKFGYIHFDAHIDCQPDVDGEKYTNWSHMARMVELPNADPKNMAVLGVRGATNPPEQWKFVEQHGISLYRMRDIRKRGVEDVVAEALEKVTNGVDAFYVSWDSDVVDAAFLPGTDGPEVGGMTSWEILKACEMVGAKKPALMDIVELIPAYDHPSYISHRLACYFIFHLLGGWATGGVS